MTVPAVASSPAALSDLATPEGFLRRGFPAMGTTVTVVLPARDAAAVAAVEAVFATWEATLSRFRPESELSRLNASAGRVVRVSPLLLRVVETALLAARATDGIFDPTLEPHLRALGYDRTFDDVARDAPAADAPSQPGPGGAWRAVEVDRTAMTIRLPRGAALDVGGIAKGMAVDAALEMLASLGVGAAVVEAGGDLAVRGLPARGSGTWAVSLETLTGTRDVAIAAGALATSGVSRRAWRRGGEELHHLVDPRTGMSARNDLWSVTAAAAMCAQAEVAAKVAFVLGRVEGARFLLHLGISALFVGRDGDEALSGLWSDGASRRAADPSPRAPAREPSLALRGLA
jgi:thiamine biosynthesis lipoprotein